MACEALEYYVTEKNTFLEVCLPEANLGNNGVE